MLKINSVGTSIPSGSDSTIQSIGKRNFWRNDSVFPRLVIVRNHILVITDIHVLSTPDCF